MVRRLAVLACALTAANSATAQVLMPPVTAHGVTCTGMICGGLLNVFIGQIPEPLLRGKHIYFMID
ncbi:MAG: hypothetical protein DYH17_16430 [Xanthomonadales bacterium PRO6]|nr:hypothetical protein [Xanthomonadales bacterium PRO6]